MGVNKKMPKRMDMGDVGHYGTSDHSRNGSHEKSHEKVGGARSRIVTGDPDELENPADGRTE